MQKLLAGGNCSALSSILRLSSLQKIYSSRELCTSPHSTVELLYDILSAQHSALLNDVTFVSIFCLFQSSFTYCSTLYNRFYIVASKLLGCLCLQVNEIVRHLSQVKSKTNELVNFVAIMDD